MNQARRRLVFLLLAAMMWLPLPQTALGGMEWTEVKEADLGIRPIQSVSSTDGKFVYLLIPGEVLVYSLGEDKVTNRVAVDVGYDRMAVSGSEAVLALRDRLPDRHTRARAMVLPSLLALLLTQAMLKLYLG